MVKFNDMYYIYVRPNDPVVPADFRNNESVNEQWADAICLEYREPGETLGHSPTRVSSLNPCGT